MCVERLQLVRDTLQKQTKNFRMKFFNSYILKVEHLRLTMCIYLTIFIILVSLVDHYIGVGQEPTMAGNNTVTIKFWLNKCLDTDLDLFGGI